MGLRQRNDLLNIDQAGFTILIWAKANTPDVDIPVTKPQYGGGEFLPKILRHQNDPHIGGEVLFISFFPVQESEHARPGPLAWFSHPRQKLAVDLYRPLKRHRGYHARVADSLKLHVAAVAGSFQFDYNQICLLVDGEQVDPTTAVLPVPKLFG